MFVLDQQVTGQVDITGPYGRNNCPMVVQRSLHPRGNGGKPLSQHRCLRRKARQQMVSPLCMGRVADQQVELAVDLRVALWIFVGNSLCGICDTALQRSNHLFGVGMATALDCQKTQYTAQFIDFVDLIDADRRHDDAVVRVELEPALCDQSTDRLSHRRLAHCERL